MHETVRIIQDTKGFNPAQLALFALFDGLGIAHVTWEHPPIFTVEEGHALDLPAQIPGLHGKSLFLKSKDERLWLVVACETTRVDLKILAERVGARRFSFARPETMLEILGVVPGSATPFAVMQDTRQQVQLVLDEAFLQGEQCVFHPLENRFSTAISVNDLIKFMNHTGHEPRILSLA